MLGLCVRGTVLILGMAATSAQATSLSTFDVLAELDLTLVSAEFTASGADATDMLSIDGDFDDGFDRSAASGSGRLIFNPQPTPPDDLNMRHRFSYAGTAGDGAGSAIADFTHDNVFLISTFSDENITLTFSYRMLAEAITTNDASGQASVFLRVGNGGVGSSNVIGESLVVAGGANKHIRSDLFVVDLTPDIKLSIYGALVLEGTAKPQHAASDLPPVPLPASSLMLGTVIAGLMMMRRRRHGA